MIDPAENPTDCPAQIENELSIVEQAMRERGFRWTAQRRLIARVALSEHSHFSAEDLLGLCRAQDRSVSRATVYRTLTVLEDSGFVEGLDTGDGGRKFEHTLGHDHHDHLICSVCGSIFEFCDEQLEARQQAVADAIGFEIRSHSLKLFGACRDCRSDP